MRDTSGPAPAAAFFQPARRRVRVVRREELADRVDVELARLRRVTVEGDDAPLDVRDDEFLSSFPFSTETPKNFAVRVGGDAARRRRTRAFVILLQQAARASLNPRNTRNTLTRTYR